MPFIRRSALVLLIIAASTMTAWPDNPDDADQAGQTIYWSDGDSGRINGMRFRLANIDAPETGSLKQRGGAKCEQERALGYEAKAFMVEYTNGKDLLIVKDYGKDRYGRLVIDMTANGKDVAQSGIQSGHLKAWPHKSGRAQMPKPDWCESKKYE